MRAVSLFILNVYAFTSLSSIIGTLTVGSTFCCMHGFRFSWGFAHNKLECILLVQFYSLAWYMITNLDLIIEYFFYATFSTFSLLMKALALLFNRLYLSKASQASLLGLNDFCIYFPGLINL